MREVIAWIKCDMCGRRSSLRQFNIGGVTLNLCPYCSLAISNYLSSSTRKARIEPDEELLRRLSGKVKSRKAAS